MEELERPILKLPVGNYICVSTQERLPGRDQMKVIVPAIAVLRTDVFERVVLHPIADPLWMRPPQRALSEFTTTIG